MYNPGNDQLFYSLIIAILQMSTNNTTSLATVADITGKVWAVAEDGSRRLLHVGDAVYEGEVIVADAAGVVVLRNAGGAYLKVTEGKEVVLSVGLFAGGENTSSLRGVTVTTDGFPPDPSTLSSSNRSGLQTLHGFLRVQHINEYIGSPVYRLWSFTGSYNSASQFRSASFNPLLEGRGTYDERLIIPVEPESFVYVEPLPASTPVVYRSLIQQNDVPKNNSTEVTASVQEDALPGGNLDTPADTTEATGSVAPLVDTGADVPVTFSL